MKQNILLCYEFIVFCLTIHQEPEPEPFYFWRVGAGAAENRAAPQLWINATRTNNWKTYITQNKKEVCMYDVTDVIGHLRTTFVWECIKLMDI